MFEERKKFNRQSDCQVICMAEALISHPTHIQYLLRPSVLVSHTSWEYGVTSTHKMRAEWFDSCASICAFCKYSQESEKKIECFHR